MKSDVIAFIFARGGSVGVKRKNVREIGGKPLIAHAIDCAKQAKLIGRVMVSTDDEEIADVARQYGAEIPFMRPDYLASSTAAELDAWRHAADYLCSADFGSEPPDMFISVPTTAPLRSPEDLDQIIWEYQKGGADLVLGVTESVRNPYMNILVKDDRGYATVVIPPSDDSPHPANRQEAPVTYDVATVGYAASLDFIQKAPTILAGKLRTVTIPEERAFDIDTEIDLEIANYLMEKRQKGQ